MKILKLWAFSTILITSICFSLAQELSGSSLSTSQDKTLTTEAGLPQTLSNISVSNLLSTTASITWNSTIPSSQFSKSPTVYYSTTTSGIATKPFTESTSCAGRNYSYLTTSYSYCIQLQNLLPNTQYIYKVVTEIHGTKSESQYNSFKTPDIVPSKPNNVSVKRSYTSSGKPKIDLSWNNTTSDQQIWKIFRINSTPTSITETVLPTVTKEATSTFDENVQSDSTYTYKIQSCSTSGVCSEAVSVSTTVPPQPKPVTPSSLFVSTSSVTTSNGSSPKTVVTINWTTVAVDTAIVLALERSTTTSGGVDSFIPLSITPLTITSFTDQAVLAGNSYAYRIRACSTSSSTLCSDYITSKTIAIASPVTVTTPLPQATTTITSINQPSGLRISVGTSAISSTTVSFIDLFWQDNSTNETKFTIYRSENSTNFVKLSESPANTKTIKDITIIPGKTYNYRIQACADTICSPSSYFSTTTIPVYESPAKIKEVVPDTPSLLKAERVSTGTLVDAIKLSWQDTQNETSYRLYKKTSNTNSLSTPVIIPKDSTQYTDTSTQNNTSYSYSISACNSTGCSNPTSLTQAILLQEPLSYEISNTLGKLTPGNQLSFKTYINSQIIANQISKQVTVNQNGIFGINLPDGVYLLEGLSQNKVVTLSNTKVASITTLAETNVVKKISGKITRNDSSSVDDATIIFYNGSTGVSVATSTNSEGLYTLILSNGDWQMYIKPNDELTATWEKQMFPTSLSFSYNTTNEEKIQNVTVSKKLSSLTVTVTDEKGAPVPSVGVILNSIHKGSISTHRTSLSSETSLSGKTTMNVLPGTYNVYVALPDNLANFKNQEVEVIIKSNENKAITITLQNERQVEKVTINGTVTFDDGTKTSAYVYAWSDKGEKREVYTKDDGIFSLELLKDDTWHVSATRDFSDSSYKTNEQIITPDKTSPTLSLVFIKEKPLELAKDVSVVKNSNEQTVAMTDDGAKFTLPSQGIANSSTVNVEIKPTYEAPAQTTGTLLGSAYDITIKNSGGQQITRLSKEAEIILPYDEEELRRKGTSPEDVVPNYYNETLETWIPVTKYILNKDKKVFILYVNHLTRYALIANADTTPPPSPTSITTDAITPTDVRISWKNPSTDFDHIKIYRSESNTSFGKLVAAEVFSNSFIDKTIAVKNKFYYYTVRAVDKAGNESINTQQVAFTGFSSNLATLNEDSTSTLLLPPGQTNDVTKSISRTLKLGDNGDDVTLLQKALKIDGFYKTGPITGYYGKLTKNAVFRFQNYYKDELLIPNGYKKGTGMVGPATQQKINSIIEKNNI